MKRLILLATVLLLQSFVWAQNDQQYYLCGDNPLKNLKIGLSIAPYNFALNKDEVKASYFGEGFGNYEYSSDYGLQVSKQLYKRISLQYRLSYRIAKYSTSHMNPFPSLQQGEYMYTQSSVHIQSFGHQVMVGVDLLQKEKWTISLQGGIYYLTPLVGKEKFTQNYYNAPDQNGTRTLTPSKSYLHYQYGAEVSYQLSERFEIFIDLMVHNGQINVYNWDSGTPLVVPIYESNLPVGFSYTLR